MKAVDLSTRVGSLRLANPIMTASGTSGHSAELSTYLDLSSLGAVVVKSVSAQRWDGNPPPRLLPLSSAGGMLNSVGLQNPGMTTWLAEDLPVLAGTGARVVASIWGFSPDAFEQAGSALADAIEAGGRGTRSLIAVECNISCPNLEDRRRMFAHSEEGVAEAIEAAVSGVRGRLPVWSKMSPNVTDLPALSRVAVDSGAEVLTLINTVMGMAIDPASGGFRLGGGGGGLSGPAIHPVAVRAVFECRSALPTAAIVGVGGVTSGFEAAEMIAAGADAVQVGTASFAEPRAASRVLHELAGWCERTGIDSIDDLKGLAHGHP